MQSPNDEGTAAEEIALTQGAHQPAGHEGGCVLEKKVHASEPLGLETLADTPTVDLLKRAAAVARGATVQAASPRLARGTGAAADQPNQSINKQLHNV